MKHTNEQSQGMSAAHKEALAKGRAYGMAVRNYLDAVDSSRPRRGRRRTPDTIGKQLEAIEKELITASALGRLLLIQRQQDLKTVLTNLADDKDISELEKEFVSVAKEYGERKGIAYSTWRSAGVSAATLQRAGIARTREARQAA